MLIIAMEVDENKEKTGKKITMKDMQKKIQAFGDDVQTNFEKVNVKLKTTEQNIDLIEQNQKEAQSNNFWGEPSDSDGSSHKDE